MTNSQQTYETLVATIRAEVTEELLGRLSGGAAPAKRAARRSASPRKGAKRSPQAIAKLTDGLLAYVKKHKGERIEQIGKAMGVPTRELALPVAKLFAAKKLRSSGAKRATKYFAR